MDLGGRQAKQPLSLANLYNNNHYKLVRNRPELADKDEEYSHHQMEEIH